MENGSILGRNKLGRLYVHTPFLMKGYLVEKGKEVKMILILTKKITYHHAYKAR
jgi:hypothetical protein